MGSMLLLLISCIATWRGETDPDPSMPEGTRCWVYGQVDDHSVTCQFALPEGAEDDCPCEHEPGECPCAPPYGEP